ncbi:MAG: DUF559 domain-containing protein [Anaerolineae bacterium]|nr:DUF559 domain-containing protein [Anaerolineae bacterium]
MNTTDWTARNALRRTVPVICPTCCETRLLRKCDADKAQRTGAVCYRCAQAAKGRRGFAATAARYGEKWAVNHVQAWRQINRTPQELTVQRWLDLAGYEYMVEYRVATKSSGKRQRVYLVDVMIVLCGRLLAIEIDGGCHVLHTRRDRNKKALLTRRGIPLLRLSNTDVENNRFAERLARFIQENADVYPAAV